MRTRRIELEGNAGHVAIERSQARDGSTNIRIDSIIRNPKGEQAWKTWEIPTATCDEELFKIAQVVQHRCDGVEGTNSDIHDYFREMQRFQD